MIEAFLEGVAYVAGVAGAIYGGERQADLNRREREIFEARYREEAAKYEARAGQAAGML